ncbi:hypothetical protein Sipo8835_22985 [Streptomyces ipomoeae]|uniref:Uncharacterized protein n=1 Tax=Streptomyces ipomoeae TaxID=103232 RepID=A0AAE9AYV1_9ACTN|nr:hypothetical protein [Streptomyces ipomoeae]TQE30860.1 hypothetical protein Sipo8835_22985 [Streptomyces ipomoeae]
MKQPQDPQFADVVLALCADYLRGRTEWDETPEALVLRDVNGTGLAWESLDIPEAAWRMAHPPVVLAGFAHLAAQPGLINLPQGVVAVAFRYEAFVIAPYSSPEAAEAIRRRQAGGSTPHNEHVPGRVEQRAITAVDACGRQYMVAADRQTDGGALLSTSKVLLGSQQLKGNVPSSLNELMGALSPQPTPHQGSAG